MKTILITAYAINPFKGSEDGTGWNMSYQIAKRNKVIVITRENNQPHIEKYLAENPDSVYQNMDFQYFDLPYWAMWWKKKIGERGYVLYYYLWQLFMPLFVLRKKLKFDIAHCLNFHSDSHPHFLWVFDKPVFWGPIGHHPSTPKVFLERYHGSNLLKDKVYQTVKWCMRNLDPFYRLSVLFSDKIFVINSAVPKKMRVKKDKVTILPAVASKPSESMGFQKTGDDFVILSVGRFHYMKGFDVAINAFDHFIQKVPVDSRSKVKLQLVGKGEEESLLKEIAGQSEFSSQIEFIPWVSLQGMKDIYNAADVFLFPSHEGAGMVIPEAMSHGLPIVCFDNVGPGELAGEAALKVKYDSDYDIVVSGFGHTLHNLYFNLSLRKELSRKSYERFTSQFKWEHKAEVFQKAYDQVLEDIEGQQTPSIAVFHPSSELYGADRILVNALKAYPESHKKQIYLYKDGPLVNYIKEHVTNADVHVNESLPFIHRSIFTPMGVLKFIRNWVEFLIFFIKEHRKHQFKSVYYNTLACSFMLPVSFVLRITSWVHVHEIIESPLLISKLTAFSSYLFANHTICVSRAVQHNLIKHVPRLVKTSRVIHNGIHAVKAEKTGHKEKVNFYLFGRIMEKKGHWFLVEALSKLSMKTLDSANFTIMGGPVSGHEYKIDQLRDALKAKGLDPFVSIKGFEKDISRAMADADVCLVPSIMKDPFPTTVLEAMSAGKPVIATKHGGAAEAIEDGVNGFLVGKNDADKLASRIKELIVSRVKIKDFGNKARHSFEEKFTMTVFSNNLIDFLTRNSIA